jgi:hypothetical protein
MSSIRRVYWPPRLCGKSRPNFRILRAQNAVLLHQVRERLPLPAIQPARENGEHEIESRRVEHGASLQHEARARASGIGRVVGQNGFREVEALLARVLFEDAVLSRR